MTKQLRDIELAALRAWPAANDHWMDTWLVRIDRGYTKRANGIYAWGSPESNLPDQIKSCTSLVRSANLPIILREATWNPVPGLAEYAADQGALPFDHTIVMTRPLTKPIGWSPAPAPALPLDTWLANYLTFEGGTKGNQAIHREILERIQPPKLLAVHFDEELPVSIGLAVADGPLLGLFDIATDPDQRGRGHASVLLSGMLAWGWSLGCTTAYLQVMATNEPACRLYAKLGFTEAFRYHYYRLEPSN